MTRSMRAKYRRIRPSRQGSDAVAIGIEVFPAKHLDTDFSFLVACLTAALGALAREKATEPPSTAPLALRMNFAKFAKATDFFSCSGKLTCRPD